MVFQPGVFQPGVFQGAANSVFVTIATQETGADTAAIDIATQGKIWSEIAAQEAGSDTASVSIHTLAKIWAAVLAGETGADTAAVIVDTKGKSWVAIAARESGPDTAAISIGVHIALALSATEAGKDGASIFVSPIASAALSATETGSDSAAIVASTVVKRWVALAATETGQDVATILGSSNGQVIVIARDVEGGIGQLVELGCWDRDTNSAATLYFASVKFTTRPSDPVPNQYYMERLQEPGDYRRSLFANGTTHGQISVGAGYIEIAGNDGELDDLRRRYAFDGYALRIKTIPRIKPRYEDAVTIFAGTVEQVELSWDKVTVRMRDRLASLDVEHQDVLYAGTTIAGAMNEAEGTPEDLKGKGKELAYGRPLLVPAVAANSFDRIFGLGADGLEAIEDVRDRGVALTANGSNYTTVAALRAASISAGQYATARALGLIRTGSNPVGQITARPVEKSSSASRTAAQVARRMLLRKGFVEGVDFRASDVAALDALNAAPVGFWMPPEDMTTLSAVQQVLGSIGATIVPDRLGVFRMMRFGEPTGFPVVTLTGAEILGNGIELLATGDEGRGVPAWRVTVRYARNWYPVSRDNLDVATSAAFKAFATTEWRSAVAEAPGVKTVNRLASDLTFDSYLTEEADALAEANRLLSLHSVPRERFQVQVKGFLVERVELGSPVRLQHARFGLSAGKDFVTIGLAEDFETGTTTLDLWG